VRRRQAALVVIFLLIAGSSLDYLVNIGDQGLSVNQFPYLLIAGVSVFAAAFSWYYYQREIPPNLKREFKKSSEQWTGAVQLDSPPAYIFAIAALFNATTVIASPVVGIATDLVYLAISSFAYMRYKERFSSPYFITVVFSSVATLACTFAGTFAVNPNYLVQFGVPLYPSRSFAFLFFFASETGLCIATTYFAAYSWRTRMLMKNGMDVKSLEDLQGLAMSKVKQNATVDSEAVDQAASDIPRAHGQFRDGNFDVVVSLGWTVLERMVKFVDTDEKPVSPIEAAKRVGFWQQSLTDVYRIRNRLAHRGSRATHTDALEVMREIRRFLLFASKLERGSRDSG